MAHADPQKKADDDVIRRLCEALEVDDALHDAIVDAEGIAVPPVPTVAGETRHAGSNAGCHRNPSDFG